MAIQQITPPLESMSPTDGNVRKRVCKACDRCRLKKSKVRSLANPLAGLFTELVHFPSVTAQVLVRDVKPTMRSVFLESARSLMTKSIPKGELGRQSTEMPEADLLKLR
jgi:hypothetical protein